MGPGPHPHPGDGHGAHTAETSGWAGVHRRVCTGKRNRSSGARAHAGEGGAGPALCRDVGSTAQANPSASSLSCGRSLCCPTCQGRKEGHVPTGTLPSASAQGPSPGWHRGPRTLSPDVVAWEGLPGKAVHIRLWPGAAGPGFPGAVTLELLRPATHPERAPQSSFRPRGSAAGHAAVPMPQTLAAVTGLGPSLCSKIRT